MADKDFNGATLEFPLDCHFRVIVENKNNGIKNAIEEALAKVNVQEKLKEQNLSKLGTYRTFSLDVKVFSKDGLKLIDEAIRDVPGVKMVL